MNICSNIRTLERHTIPLIYGKPGAQLTEHLKTVLRKLRKTH